AGAAAGGRVHGPQLVHHCPAASSRRGGVIRFRTGWNPGPVPPVRKRPPRGAAGAVGASFGDRTVGSRPFCCRGRPEGNRQRGSPPSGCRREGPRPPHRGTVFSWTGAGGVGPGPGKGGG